MLEEEIKLIEQRRINKRYTSSFKKAVVEKVINNPKATFQQIADEMGVSYNNVYSWYNKYKGKTLSLKSGPAPKVLDEQQLFWVRETIGAAQRDKVRYCRAYGIPYSKLKEWTELYKDTRYKEVLEETTKVSKDNKELSDKKDLEIKELRKQLNEAIKEKNNALALLELKKKVDQLLQETCLEEENSFQKK